MKKNPRPPVLNKYAIIGFILLFSVSGCLVGPDYERPEVEVPTEWKALDSADPERGPRMVTEILPEAEWWEAFENDELSWFIGMALRKNHNVREAAFRVLEGRANIVSSGASLYPQFNMNGSWTEVGLSRTLFPGETENGEPKFPLAGSTFGVGRAVIDLSWELDLWGRIRRGVEAASADMDALEMDRRGVALSLISEVGQTYFRIREFDEQIEIAEKNLKIRQDSLDIISSRAEAGLASDLDVRRAEVL
ncbi:MAG: TolC family protein, partial [Nitrospirales bacterium]|nr:TolC family protein [Nitrospirales bacterium]